MGKIGDDDLYERDFYAWTQDQAVRLRSLTGNNRFDVERVAEEIQDLGVSERKTVESHILNMLVHLLKLAHSPAAEPRAVWVDEVLQFQSEAEIHYTPSMRQHIDLDRIWRKAVKRANVSLINYGEPGISNTLQIPFSLDELLTDDFDPNAAEERVQEVVANPGPAR
jgi:hypothetical protein